MFAVIREYLKRKQWGKTELFYDAEYFL